MVRRFSLIFGLLALLSASAAAQAPNPAAGGKPRSEVWAEARAKVAAMSNNEVAAALDEALRDQTRMYKQTGHGVYLEYTSPSGELFMWYRNNAKAVHGSWKIETSYTPPRACFKYLNATHGVTGEYEPRECVPPEQTLGAPNMIGARKGDPFKLSSGAIPYVKSADDIPVWPD